MDDALIRVADIEQSDAGSGTGGAGFGDEGGAAGHRRHIAAAGKGIDDMVHRRKGPRRIGNGAPGGGEAGERRSAGAFVEEDAVDGDDRRAAGRLRDGVAIP